MAYTNKEELFCFVCFVTTLVTLFVIIILSITVGNFSKQNIIKITFMGFSPKIEIDRQWIKTISGFYQRFSVTFICIFAHRF